MGMDVYGKAPISEVGAYFRNNVWYWRPLAQLCLTMAPEICAPCEHWQSNDGDGLDGSGAEALATVLRKRLEDGTIARYVAARDKHLAEMADEACTLCSGTGVRSDAIGREHGMPAKVIHEDGHPRDGQTGWCNACEGRGQRRPFEANYPCAVENVAEFADFLAACGGFEIC